MLTGFCRLGLEVKRLDAARTFYEERLGLRPEAAASETSVAYEVGEASTDIAPTAEESAPTTLVLRRPTDVPRGGVHTHYAFSTTRSAYARWRRRLADLDPVEFSFGSSDSLYVYDPGGHCVEIGGIEGDDGGNGGAGDGDGDEGDNHGEGGNGGGGDSNGGSASDDDGATVPPLTGIFEVVLEVTDLSRAESRYRRLGFEVVDRGEKRRRVRLTGPVDLELWEPQLGIADARGGLHVDLAFATPNPDAAVEAGAPWPDGPEHVPEGLRVVDDDGHLLTFVAPTSLE